MLAYSNIHGLYSQLNLGNYQEFWKVSLRCCGWHDTSIIQKQPFPNCLLWFCAQSPGMGSYKLPVTITLSLSQILLGGQSRESSVEQGGWSLTHVLTLDSDFPEPTPNHYHLFWMLKVSFFPWGTFRELITIGMWIFLSRVGQNKECDHYSLLIKEASHQLLFKRQSKPSWHWVTLQTAIPQSRTSPMLCAQDQGVDWLQALALQNNCSIML